MTNIPNQYDPYPELKLLSHEELRCKALQATEWLAKHKGHHKYHEGVKKYNWIVHRMLQKQPKDMPVSEVLSYLL